MDELFEKYDVENIKTILIAKHMNEDKEKTENLVTDTGLLSRELLQSVLNSKSVKEAVFLLSGTKYGKALWSGFLKYEKSGDVSDITKALDEYYSNSIPQIAENPVGDERIIASMLVAEIDAKNISNVLRGLKAGLEPKKILGLVISGGSITKEKFVQAINSKSVEEAMSVFSNKIGSQKVVEEYKKSGSLIPLELELEKKLVRKGLHVLRTSVLSLGAIVGILYLKEQEVSNIRKIIRAKEFGVPIERIKEMLVVV